MKIHVLLVDDDDDLRELLALTLGMAGFVVYEAANGRDALAMGPGIPSPRVMVLDLLMPVMNGWETIAEMDRSGMLETFPVVVSTSAPNQAPHGLPVIPKPTPLDRLKATIRAIAR